jgi:hypothetical protein
MASFTEPRTQELINWSNQLIDRARTIIDEMGEIAARLIRAEVASSEVAERAERLTGEQAAVHAPGNRTAN